MTTSTHQELLQTTVQAAGQLFRDSVADDVGNLDTIETLRSWRQVETLVFGSHMHALLSGVLRHLEALA